LLEHDALETAFRIKGDHYLVEIRGSNLKVLRGAFVGKNPILIFPVQTVQVGDQVCYVSPRSAVHRWNQLQSVNSYSHGPFIEAGRTHDEVCGRAVESLGFA